MTGLEKFWVLPEALSQVAPGESVKVGASAETSVP